MLQVTWDKGLRLANVALWFDSGRYEAKNFVSSARIKEAWRYRDALCTDRTRFLIRVSRAGFQAIVAPYGKPISLGPFEVTLLPAGFMPGSAQILIESDKSTLLYANNLSLEAHPLAEPLQIKKADTLVVRSVYGCKDFAFPPRAQAYAQVVEIAKKALEGDCNPVFLVSPLGKAQEVIRCLTEGGFCVIVHRSIAKYNRAYRNMGFEVGKAKIFKGGVRPGEVLVFPEVLYSSPAIRRLKRPWLVWVSGLAAASPFLAKMRVDEGIPLSGHLDFAGLLRYVEEVAPRRVVAVGPNARDFALALGKEGLEATVVSEEEQLSLF